MRLCNILEGKLCFLKNKQPRFIYLVYTALVLGGGRNLEMDHEVFLVRAGGISGRPQKGVSRILKVLDNGISISGVLPSVKQSPAVYNYERIVRVSPSPADLNELRIDVSGRFNEADETLRFCCDSRTDLLTALLNKLDDVNGIGTDYFLKKHSNQQGGLIDTIFRVRSASIVKMMSIGVKQERRKVTQSKKINFQDIVKMEIVADDEHALLLYFKSRVMRLSVKESLPFLEAIQTNTKTHLNIALEIGRITTQTMIENVSAYLREVRESPVLYEFEVLKRLDAKKQVRKRVVSLTNGHLIERSNDDIVAVHRLDDVQGLIVTGNDSNEVLVELRFWRPTQYFVEDVESFVSSIAILMDTRKCCHFNIHQEPLLSGTFPDKPHPVYQSECEAFYINQLMGIFRCSQDPKVLHGVLRDYACNIHAGESQCNDIRVIKAVADVLQSCIRAKPQDMHCATLCCMVLRSLFGSRPLFESLNTIPEVFTILLQCIQSENGVLAYLASLAIRGSLKFSTDGGLADNSLLKLESTNKLALLNVENMQRIVATLHNHSLAKSAALQILGLLEVVFVSVSKEYFDNESEKTWVKAVDASIMAASKVICVVFRCPNTVIFKRNSMVLKSLLTKTTPEVRQHIQNLCLSQGVVLMHLKNALFSKEEEIWRLSADLLYLMIEGNSETRNLLESLLPKGVMLLYSAKFSDISPTQSVECDEFVSSFCAWMETVEILRKEIFATPLLMWNDMIKMQLFKFLEDELERFYAALVVDHDLSYNSADVELNYSASNEGDGSVICGVHLELLPGHSPLLSMKFSALWQIKDHVSLFQSVFQAMVLGFTPFFGNNNLPEVDLRLAAHVLTWIYEQHSENLFSSLESLNVIEIVVGILREVIESEHQVFVFKLIAFLLVLVEIGGRKNVLRFVHAGGMTVLVPLIALSLSKCCRDKCLFESDAWDTKTVKSQGAIETVKFVGHDGMIKLIRVPSGRAQEVLEKALQDGSLDARQAIHWKDAGIPGKVQLGLALDLLEAILRISGVDTNIGSFPPSAACCSLSREEVLCHLVQILLRARTPVFGRILEIISYISRINRDAMQRLYKYGIFEILLWKLLAGDLVDSEKIMIIKFLRQCHLSQDAKSVFQGEDHSQTEEHSPWRNSILRLYLPEGLILKLVSEDDCSFKTIFDSDNYAPEVIWNSEMRESLLEHLTNELGTYVKFRASDPLALYIYSPKPPLEYPELTDTIFIEPFYLKNLIDVEQFPNYEIVDPAGFLNNLIKDLRRCTEDLHNSSTTFSSSSLWRKDTHQIHLLLQALGHLLDRCTISSLPDDLESVVTSLATPALRTCLAQKDDSPHVAIEIIQCTSKILRRSCAGNSRNSEVPQAALDFSSSLLLLGTDVEKDTCFPESMCNSKLESSIADSFLVLELLCTTRAGRGVLEIDTRWREGLWWALCSAAGDASSNPSRGPTTTSFAALRCLKYFTEDEEHCETIIKQGLYLPLLLLVVPPNDSTLKTHYSMSAVLYSAADVLGSLVRVLNRTEQFSNTRSQGGKSILSRIIPTLLLQCFEETDGPENFISFAVTDFILPTSIWTKNVREELRQKVSKHLELHNSNFRTGNDISMENELEWLQSFQYECLEDELIIGGLFVRGLCCSYIENFNLPKGHSYIDAIQDYLESNLESLTNTEVYDTQDGMRQDAVATYLSVLVALRRCLTYAVRKGREDLIRHFKPHLLSSVALEGVAFSDIQVEIATVVKTLSEHQSARDMVIQSVMMKALAVQLWHASVKKGSEQVLMATLEAIVILSENMPATISATNYFATSGLLLPLLALFCKVGLPVLSSTEENEVTKLEPTPLATQLLAAQVIGQLLLAASGIIRRTKLLKDVAELRSFSNGSFKGTKASDDKIGQATDMYELLNIIEIRAGKGKEEPLAIITLLLLLPLELLSTVAHDPSESCEMYNGQCQSPRLVWNEDRRVRVKAIIREEAENMQKLVANKGLNSMPSWFLKKQQPVFLRWVLIKTFGNDSEPLYKDNQADGYAREMYIGGFYIDQFLRNPEFDFGTAIELRFVHELRKAIIMRASKDANGTEVFDFEDKRRLLLALLLLFKLRPSLLAHPLKFDIFLPVYGFISDLHNSEQKGLAQIAILLLQCTATNSDVADCMSTEDLIGTLSSLLDLDVPKSDAGFAGTDPKLCSLFLLLRLSRLSCKAVEHAVEYNVIPKLINIIRMNDGATGGTINSFDIVRQKAAECLTVMSSDKRKGQDVCKTLDKLMPKYLRDNEEWKVPLADIRDEVVDSKTLNHLLVHRCPSSWWISHHSDYRNENGRKYLTQ